MRDRSHPPGGHLAVLIGTAVLCACTAQQAAAPETPPPSGMAVDVRVTQVALGSSVGQDKRIREPKDVFAPEDTIHVSVVTEGTSPDTLLGARWLYQGRTLEETTQPIAPDGSATSEFHISRPGGLDKGDYEVEILVEGKPAGRRGFSVR